MNPTTEEIDKISAMLEKGEKKKKGHVRMDSSSDKKETGTLPLTERGHR